LLVPNASFYAQCDDSSLVDAMVLDDKQAFEEIYKRYWSRIFWFTYRKLKEREAAEEIVQDLFVNVWNKRAAGRIQKLEQYLFAAARHRVIDHIRARLTHENYAEYYQAFVALQHNDTEETVAVNDLSVALAESLDKLPEKSREVFHLSRMESRSVREIAALLNLSEKAVEYHISKALRILRSRLKDFVTIFLFFFCY
jgi:RNA polymerase sigma-70 factor (ECF subfamily)